MTSYFITGIAGSGKSAVCGELTARGFAAGDTDDFGYWRNALTKERVDRPSIVDDPAWHDQNRWIVPRRRVREALAQHACEDIVYMCGTSSNDKKLSKLFDGVICLTLDPETLVRRILSRPNSDFGKSEEELSVIRRWHTELESKYQQRGAIMIDAELPLDEVVDRIVHTTVDSRDLLHS